MILPRQLLAVVALAWPVLSAAQSHAVSSSAMPITAEAHRIEQAPQIDGILDEDFWAQIPPISDFRQREPADGAVPTERTEVRIAYDEDHLYFGLTMYDANPEQILARILHREGPIGWDDRIIIALDTYHDRRNAYIFELNPLGTQGDALITDEQLVMSDWNWEGIYHSEGKITSEGWVLEVAIPFTTIRFNESEESTMGLAVYRSIRRKNEEATWPHIPLRYGAGIFQVSQYATLSGLRGIRRGRDLEVKPFVIGGGQRFDDGNGTNFVHDVGLDVKYGLSSNFTLDLTLNTDFAQVEADNVQINLTRFNLFFPEKREFFLERAGLFSLGAPRETEVFFSRRVGIASDILGGGRITGQAGPVSIGVLSLQTDDAVGVSGANNSVARVRADVLPRTTVGAIVANREGGGTYNRTAGMDAAVRFWGNSQLDLWTAKVWDPDLATGTMAGAAEVILRNDLFMVEAAYNNIGENFAPDLGFVRRADQIRFGGQIGTTPRFSPNSFARQLRVFLQGNHITGQDHVKQSHFRRINTSLRFQSGEFVTVNATERFERLFSPFDIRPTTSIPAGDYTFRSVDASVRTDGSRDLWGSARVSMGDFFNGTRVDYGGSVEWRTSQYLTVAANVSRSDISLPVSDGDFSTTILGMNLAGAMSRKLFANALLQYDDVSRTLQANVRVNWIHTPGSDLFLVLDTGYVVDADILDPAASRWVRRTGVAKLTYLKAL